LYEEYKLVFITSSTVLNTDIQPDIKCGHRNLKFENDSIKRLCIIINGLILQHDYIQTFCKRTLFNFKNECLVILYARCTKQNIKTRNRQ